MIHVPNAWGPGLLPRAKSALRVAERLTIRAHNSPAAILARRAAAYWYARAAYDCSPRARDAIVAAAQSYVAAGGDPADIDSTYYDDGRDDGGGGGGGGPAPAPAPPAPRRRVKPRRPAPAAPAAPAATVPAAVRRRWSPPVPSAN
ncbi:MAG TPA: hypothetical protein VGJ05_08815 [Fimbriiglobus sp.]|jgi:hypothetical protein